MKNITSTILTLSLAITPFSMAQEAPTKTPEVKKEATQPEADKFLKQLESLKAFSSKLSAEDLKALEKSNAIASLKAIILELKKNQPKKELNKMAVNGVMMQLFQSGKIKDGKVNFQEVIQLLRDQGYKVDGVQDVYKYLQQAEAPAEKKPAEDEEL